MSATLLQGNCITVLKTLPENSVHCIVTSPPYYGLRDYNTGTWEGGNPECDHKGEKMRTRANINAHTNGARDLKVAEQPFRATCGKCGAVRVDEQIGLEETPDAYVAKLVEVFRECWRVLRPDGTLWVNIGDSFSNEGKTGGSSGCKNYTSVGGGYQRTKKNTGLKPKDLVGIPWRLAFALQADGWYLRSDIIWHKPNALPESVEDRPTKSHEYIFLFSKSPRYYYDGEAIKEQASRNSHPRASADVMATVAEERKNGASTTEAGNHRRSPKVYDDHDLVRQNASFDGATVLMVETRNKRSVWSVNSHAYPGAHFATYPPKLIEPCILAGTSARGCCPRCGAPWVRKLDREVNPPPDRIHNNGFKHDAMTTNGEGDTTLRCIVENRTIGWRPTCACGAPAGLRPGDLDTIGTPTGERVGDDPTMTNGRRGLSRPRGDGEGRRPITRYEQRHYAAQMKQSPHRAKMESEAGEAFAHYLRTDRAGARPLPENLLSAWVERGWLSRVEVPVWDPPPPVPCTVLDPFNGAGTTGLVAIKHRLDYIGIDLNPAYIKLTQKRFLGAPILLAL